MSRKSQMRDKVAVPVVSTETTPKTLKAPVIPEPVNDPEVEVPQK